MPIDINRSKTFCVMPHIALAMQNNGDISVCHICKTVLNIDGQSKRINEVSMSEFWTSPDKSAIIDDLDNGVEHQGCSVCWNKEKAGVTSARQTFNKSFKHLDISDKPKVLIMKPGNTCNMACRTCYPETSSSLYSDHYKIYAEKHPNVSFNQYIKDFESVRNSFSEDNPNFWPVLNDWYDDIELIDIYGGEPWLIRGLWKSLQNAADTGRSKHIDLMLHTNAMTWNEGYMKLLSQFRSVKIGLSLDSHVKEQFEYIRHKSDYYKIFENCDKFIRYAARTSNISCHITLTVSILNIWNIDEILTNLKSRFNVNINPYHFVVAPAYYDIRHLPREVKANVIKKLSNNGYNELVSYVNSSIHGCDIYWPKFCLITDKFDKIRNQNFKAIFPDWYAILEPFWDYTKRHPEWYGTV